MTEREREEELFKRAEKREEARKRFVIQHTYRICILTFNQLFQAKSEIFQRLNLNLLPFFHLLTNAIVLEISKVATFTTDFPISA